MSGYFVCGEFNGICVKGFHLFRNVGEVEIWECEFVWEYVLVFDVRGFVRYMVSRC